jgi:hypothetical protein
MLLVRKLASDLLVFWLTMASHPSGITVDIVGIEASDRGRSCENHKVCGSVLAPDVVVRFRAVQVDMGEGKEEAAIAAYWVSGGVDCCRVGFLRRHMVKYKEEYDGVLAQITEVFNDKTESPSDREKYHRNKGCCRACLIEAEFREPPKKKQAIEAHKP